MAIKKNTLHCLLMIGMEEWQKVIVTGVTAGQTVVTATSEDRGFTATCTVTITE